MANKIAICVNLQAPVDMRRNVLKINALFRNVMIILQTVLGMNLWANESCELYTTVTEYDFKDTQYINQLIDLNVGIELALLTPMSNQMRSDEQYKNGLDALKSEIGRFLDYFEQFQIPIEKVRIHQPGGFAYYWFEQNQLSGFDFLKDFFSYCFELGFCHFVIHTPFGQTNCDEELELKEYREKLSRLVPNAQVEVEEIVTSNHDLKQGHGLRFYNGNLFEELLKNQHATMLLDAYECGTADDTIDRLNYLTSKNFEIKSIHMQKDKHKVLTNDELKVLLGSQFHGNLINEGFLHNNSSFEEFVKTKSPKCMITNEKRVEILRNYRRLIDNPVEKQRSIVVFLGLPGSGKGTQSILLSERLSLPHVAIGDIIRQEAVNGSEFAKEIRSMMEEGKLVPDETVFSIIEKRFLSDDYKNGFILDGFPRTVAQAKKFDEMLSESNEKLTTVFYLDIPEDKIVERIIDRWTCSYCGHVFHLKFNPPKIEGICNHCHHELNHRGDDVLDRISYRLKIYKEQTAQLIEYYESQNLLKRIPAIADIDTINNELLFFLLQELRRSSYKKMIP